MIFFVNVATDIGKDNVFDENTHPSIKAINENKIEIPNFEFHEVNVDSIRKVINKIDRKKSYWG